MKKEELSTLLSEINGKCQLSQFFDEALGALVSDPVAVKNLGLRLTKTPQLVRDAIYWNKLCTFITGVNEIELSLGESTSLSSKLFDTPEKKKENGMRLLDYIDKADAQKKIEFYVDATQSLLMNRIDVTNYFRILKAVSETLCEDLDYLSSTAIRVSRVSSNLQILSLTRSGLMIQVGLDTSEDIEKQLYAVTELGYMVDQHALSLNSQVRQHFYITHDRGKIEADVFIDSDQLEGIIKSETKQNVE